MGNHTLAIRIYWENTDASGRVYHTQYIQFAERGRTEYLRLLGCEQTAILQNIGVYFVVKSLTADFMGYAQLDDEIIVNTTVSQIKGAKVIFEQHIVKHHKPIVYINTVVVIVDKNGTPKRIPKYLIDKFNHVV